MTVAGLITHRHDNFDFWRWSRQARGLPGLLLGWSPLLRRQAPVRAHSRLNRYIAALQASVPAPPTPQ